MSDNPPSDPSMPPPSGASTDPPSWDAPPPPPPAPSWDAPPPPPPPPSSAPAADWSQQQTYSDPYATSAPPMTAGGAGVPAGYQPKQKLVAGLLGIFLGGFGVHSFYLGDTKKGVIQILVTIFTCGIGSLWGLIEGILILVGNINTDANGVPLVE